MSKNNLEVDCTKQCRSKRHGQELTSAITKRSVSDEALASFMKATCMNFNRIIDNEGRTALHMAAARGRIRLLSWLGHHSTEALLNAQDLESGFTPLHRSIFYGQIHAAVNLLKMGVNTDIVEKDDYKPIEHALLDRQYIYKHEGTQPCDVYVWGSNSNYTLGTGTQMQRNTPEMLTSFNRVNNSVKQVCLGKFHSVWLCADGLAFCSGQLNRAGGPPATALRPVLLKLPEPCVGIAVTLTSTVFLLQNGAVLQYNLNNTSQSGTKIPAVIKLPSISPVCTRSNLLGVCSGRAHVVVWSAGAVHTWGTNCGQLGHGPEDKVVTLPKKVPLIITAREEARIQLVAASDAATVITTSRGDVYLLHKYLCKKIAIKQINLRQVCVEAKANEQGVTSRVTVLLLTNIGQLMIWQDTLNRVTRCVFGLSHQIIITNVQLTHDALYFTTKFGEAFIGYISRKTTPTPQPQPIRKEKERDSNKSALVKFLEKDDCTHVRITRIPNIHRAVSIAVDSEGLNFACLQIKPTCGLTSIPELSPSHFSKHMEALLETAAEDDILHDVIFKVGTKSFPAHMFVVSSSSELLYNLYKERQAEPGDTPIVVLENVHADVFDRILRYMYTGTCDVTELGPCALKIRREDLISASKREKDSGDFDVEEIENPSEISAFEAYKRRSKKTNKQARAEPRVMNLYCDPVKLVQATAKRLQVLGLHRLLDKFYYRDGTIRLKDSATLTKNPSHTWDRDNRPELVDTNVCSKDGGIIPAHKCVLAARLEYFNGMFMHSWTESKMLSQVTLPINHGILLPIINFLYTDSCPEIDETDSIDFICNMLIVADQLFISRLREKCEVALANLVNLKNCTELCQFAHTYNATQLKQCCMQFISLNIACVLENRSLDPLEGTLLDDISKYYCSFNPIMSSRVITPFDNAPTDEIIEECYKLNPVNLDYIDEEVKNNDSVIENKKRNKSKKIEYTENEKARKRYESVSSVTPLDLSNETGDITLSLSNISKESDQMREKDNKWIKIPSSQQSKQKVNLARLRAISSAKDVLNVKPAESYTRLTKNSSDPIIAASPPERSLPSSSRLSESPKETIFADIAKSQQGSFLISHFGPKLSQKQRKKLGAKETPQNLDDYLANKLNIGSPPEKPRNPWKVIEPVASSSPKSKEVGFNQILADQKKQKDDSSRIMTKPLIMTQLEDKAIEELERFYNIHEIDDELITVRRIELQITAPQWIHTAPK